MGKLLSSLDPFLTEFIHKQKIFFVATAMPEGRINLSPKGIDSFRVLEPNRAIWLNLTGSGNETAAQLLHQNRITVMFCSFEGPPLILRLYGKANVYHPRNQEWNELISHFNPTKEQRQIIDVHIESVQTSCGFGVPILEFKEDRTELTRWGVGLSDKKIEQYWCEKNNVSLDRHPTFIADSQDAIAN